MSSTMQLEFTQAMSDFKTMFPDMDHDVIEAVLRANQGAVDATIDQLLAMSTDNQNEKLRQEIEQVECGATPPPPPPPLAKRKPASDDASADLVDEAILVDPDSVPLSVQRKWTPKLLGPLPASFLRIPSADGKGDADSEDEHIALFLQNEEFMAELRWNQDFLSALDSEQGRHESKVKLHDDDAVFKERLKNMGKLSRKKFSQLSKMFTWQSKKSGGPARHGPAPDSLLLQEEHSDDEDRPGHSTGNK